MSVSPELRERLQTLQIANSQRPTQRGAAKGRLLPALLLVIVIGGGGAATWYYLPQIRSHLPEFSPGQGSAAVRLVPVTVRSPGEPTPLLTGTGKIVSDHKVQVATKVSGQVVELRFEQGDFVEKGQVLARIEDVNYRARRDEAAAMLEKSRANVEYQRINFERIRRLRETQQSSDIEFADARRWYDEAVAQVTANEAALKFAQKQLDDCEVVAPIAGVVLERNVEVGDFVAAEGGRGANANAQFASIADMTKLRVEVDVSELDINRVRREMPCLVTPDAHKDQRYQGFVMWIDPGANYAKATVQVKVRILEPDPRLRVEGAAQVAFLSEKPGSASRDAQPRLFVPESAVRTSGAGGGTVFVADAGKLRETHVALGPKAAGQFEVLSGLSAGQSIAADGLDKLRDGQRIRP